MARTKPKPAMEHIKDLAAANAALAQIAALRRELAAIESGMNDVIDQVKAEAEAQASRPQARLAALEAGLKAFADYQRGDILSDRKSRTLDFGVIGYRKSTRLVTRPRVKLADVLEKCREHGLAAGIKVKESLNREAMHEWPDERLELVGMERRVEDVFFYEVDEARVADKN